MHIGKTQAIRITDIVAILHAENYTPPANLRLLVPIDEVKSFIVTETFTYGSPFLGTSIIKKVQIK